MSVFSKIFGWRRLFCSLLVIAWVPVATLQSFSQTGSQTIELSEGWNLISFQVLPENPNPDNVLSGLSADPATVVESLWGFDSSAGKWISWAPGSPLSTITGEGIAVLNSFQGYWLNVNSPNLTLTVLGAAPASGRVDLREGWNLVGFPSRTSSDLALNQINAIFRDHVVGGADADVDLIYTISETDELLRWDSTLDRKEGDYNGDGLVSQNVPNADTRFKADFGLPDDDAALMEIAPNDDQFSSLASGRGYWVLARRAFSLEPRLKILVAGDADQPPLGNFPGPEDTDFDNDGVQDSGAWISPDEVSNSIQSTLFFSFGQKTSQIVVNNGGAGILVWKVEFVPSAALAALSTNSLIVDRTEGETLTATDNIRLTVDRTGLPSGRHTGTIQLTSNGGSRTLDVIIDVPEILGDFRGMATIATVNGKTATLPAIDLSVTFIRSPDGMIRGQIRSDDSAHFPVPVPLQGAQLVSGSSKFISIASYALPKNAVMVRAPNTLDFSVVEGPADPTLFDVNTINPFPRPIFRELVFIGDRTREDIGITGEFYDTISGVTADPIVLVGTFELTRDSLTPSIQPTAGGSTPFEIGSVVQQAIPDTTPTPTEKFFVLDELTGGLAITEPVLIDEVLVYAQLNHPNKSQLRIRLLSPTEFANAANPSAGVLLYDGSSPNAPTFVSNDVSWPRLFSTASQALFPQEGAQALASAYRGQLANQGDGKWRLGVTDSVNDNSSGRVSKWLISFVGPRVYQLTGRVVDSTTAQPIAGATVTISGAEVLSHTDTTADGRFQFSNVPQHRYWVSASKPGYAFNEIKVDLAADADEVIELNPQVDPNPAPDFDLALPTGSTGGNQIVMANAVFAGGGVVPFEFYPSGSDLEASPGLFSPVGANNPARASFTYQVTDGGSTSLALLGEDMVVSSSVDLNRPNVRPDFAGSPWNSLTDPWRPNNPTAGPDGTDLNLAEPLLGNPSNDFSLGPVNGVGWVTYDLMPGDGGVGPIPPPAPEPDTPNRFFTMTVCLGAPISGRSVGGDFALSGGARFEFLPRP